MVSREELGPLLAEAIAPSAADVVVATEAVLAKLGHGTGESVGALIHAASSSLGASPAAATATFNAGDGSLTAVDRNAPLIVAHRARLAAQQAIARLVAAGQLVPIGDPAGFDINVFTGNQMFSTTGPIRIPAATPALAAAYRLTPGLDPESALPLTSTDTWVGEAGPLLTDRTRRTLAEALTAARRGLYQAALTLLGAVSEGAWYVVGEAFRAQSNELADYLDREATAQVQRLVRDQLAKVRSQRSTAGELYAHASYLRDIRNYGIHAGGDQQESLEHAFTEAATGLLVLQTQRHLVRLLVAARAAGADL